MTPEELRAWLDARPEATRAQEAVWIASRAAARVLPLLILTLGGVKAKFDLTFWHGFRAVLISEVAAIRSNGEIKSSAFSDSFGNYAPAYPGGLARTWSDPDSAARADAAYATRVAASAAFTADAEEVANFAVDASAYAARAASHTTNAPVYAVRVASAADAAFLEDNGLERAAPSLWHGPAPDDLSENWEDTKLVWSAAVDTIDPNMEHIDWSFWINWYDALLDGRPQNIDMLTEIALIDDADWDKGPAHVNPMINDIVAKYTRAPGVSFEDILGASLTDYRFDQLAYVMRAVPIEEDWRHLSEPDRLAAFLADAQDLVDSLELLAAAFQAEGAAMQGAGAAQTYLNAVTGELQSAKAVDLLRVDKLIEFGRILERMAGREDTRLEFGALAEALDECLGKLRDLVRRHFAHVLARMAPLRDLQMEDHANQWEVIAEFRAIVSGIRSGAGGVLPPLAAEDAAVLDDLLDSVEARLRDLDAAASDSTKSSLQREINFQLAKIGASASLYLEKSNTAAGKSGKAIDDGLKWEKRITGVAKLGKWLKDHFDSGSF